MCGAHAPGVHKVRPNRQPGKYHGYTGKREKGESTWGRNGAISTSALGRRPHRALPLVSFSSCKATNPAQQVAAVTTVSIRSTMKSVENAANKGATAFLIEGVVVERAIVQSVRPVLSVVRPGIFAIHNYDNRSHP